MVGGCRSVALFRSRATSAQFQRRHERIMRKLVVSGLVLLAAVVAVHTVGAAKKAKLGQKLDQADMEMMKKA